MPLCWFSHSSIASPSYSWLPKSRLVSLYVCHSHSSHGRIKIKYREISCCLFLSGCSIVVTLGCNPWAYNMAQSIEDSQYQEWWSSESKNLEDLWNSFSPQWRWNNEENLATVIWDNFAVQFCKVLDKWTVYHSESIKYVDFHCFWWAKRVWQPFCAQTHQHLWWEFFIDHASPLYSTSSTWPSKLFLLPVWRRRKAQFSAHAMCLWISVAEGEDSRFSNGFARRAAKDSALPNWSSTAKEGRSSFFWVTDCTEGSKDGLPARVS